MPVDLELFMGTSPPILGQSPVFGGSFYSNYQTLLHNKASSLFSQVIVTSVNTASSMSMTYTTTPRSCLIFKKDDDYCFNKNIYPPLSPTKEKKRVVFADDIGYELTEVRVMKEPSNCPPRWSAHFFDQITKRVQPEQPTATWALDFNQPASDYLSFRQKIDNHCISLENVIMKGQDDIVSGTIKVKNIAYHKDVFIRLTYDGWKNCEDVPATYVKAGTEGTSVVSLFDTFSFSIKVPSNKKINRIEMCACFRCEGVEYWDNNDGKNYVIISVSSKTEEVEQPKADDALKITMDSWAGFASWNHLNNNGPYW